MFACLRAPCNKRKCRYIYALPPTNPSSAPGSSLLASCPIRLLSLLGPLYCPCGSHGHSELPSSFPSHAVSLRALSIHFAPLISSHTLSIQPLGSWVLTSSPGYSAILGNPCLHLTGPRVQGWQRRAKGLRASPNIIPAATHSTFTLYRVLGGPQGFGSFNFTIFSVACFRSI